MSLYPPILASSMPAFDINDGKVRVYYTLSSYNAARIDDIQAVHVSVRRQSSNVNVLKNPTEIVEKPFGLQQDIDKVLNRYFVEITTEDLNSEGFKANALYKVQLRLSSISSSNTSGNTDFYSSNINSFSEWSTVCIIKPIQAPEFYINDFYTGQAPQQGDQNNFYANLADFVGVYKQKDSSESLKCWRMRLLSDSYNEQKDSLNIESYTLADSGIVLNNARNYNLNDSSVIISCSLPYQFSDGARYKLLYEIFTKNGYEGSILYSFTCNITNIDSLQGTLTTYVNEEEGYIKIDFNSSQSDMTNIVIRRSDSLSNFLKWEDLKYIEVYGNQSFTYYDFTIQSGLFYRYLVQKVDSRGRRGTPLYDQTKNNNTGIIVEWQHPFLLEATGNGDLVGTKQLKLKYDFQISSYKTNIAQSKTDTIGSKYPFIRRNGNMYYRSFPVTGTITECMDQANLFTNSNELFNGLYNKYKEFKGQLDYFVNRYDYTYERKFRERVEEFLYNSKPKLYKSTQEGNIFIKLMDVSLTPKNELGRLVYSFSATAYEIDEATVDAFNSHGLISIGHFNPNLLTTELGFGQITSYGFNDNILQNPFKAGQDIIGAGQAAAANSIAKKIKYDESFNNSIISDFVIDWLRFTIESDPYLIIEENGKYRPFDDIDFDGSDPIDFTDPIDYPLYQIQSTYNKTNVYLGWLFEINDKQIIISPPNNIYQLKDQNFFFRKEVKIIPAKDTAMLIDYRLTKTIKEDTSKDPKIIRMHKVNGQLMGCFDEETELISRINYKYKYTYEKGTDKVKRAVNGVKTVLVDTEPGAVIKLKTSVMGQEERFVVNETGQLNFDPSVENVYISSLKVVGMNIPFDQNRIIPQSYFNLPLVDSGGNQIIDSGNNQLMTHPKNEYFYEGDLKIENNNYYYYHNAKWYPAFLMDQDTSLDVYCPVDALIFYFATVEERIY